MISNIVLLQEGQLFEYSIEIVLVLKDNQLILGIRNIGIF